MTAPRRRAVVLVGGPANPYSRATRIGRTLVAAGYNVEISATTEAGAPTEQHDGDLLIHRYAPSGPFKSLAPTYRWTTPDGSAARAPLPIRVLRTFRSRAIAWWLWPHTVRGWWHTLARELAPADLYHACGVLPIAAALAARERDRRAGRRSVVIHDVIDVTMASNNVLGMPGPVRRFLERRERGWARRADAHVAVNQPFADRVATSWGLARTPVVVPNYPEPVTLPEPPPDRIRATVGLPPSTHVALFWGRLGPNLGLDEMAEAVLRVPDTALVLLGFGRGWERNLARDADPRFQGRHFTLPAVHPDELASWVVSADVALVALPPVSYNQRYTTPNKFLEAMAAGVPMVLGPNLPTMEGILRSEDLGRVAASMDPDDIARSIGEILAIPGDERRAWRARIAATGRERYSWPVAAAAYRRLLDDLGA